MPNWMCAPKQPARRVLCEGVRYSLQGRLPIPIEAAMAATGLKPGTTVSDRYRVSRILGHGELGCSYLCRDLAEGDAFVVLRTLTEWDVTGGVNALRLDLSALSRFRHPNLVHILDFGVMERGAVPYVVRAFVDGKDILQESATWDPEQILFNLVKLCRVLHYLHSRNVVHRHIKPSNIIIAGDEVTGVDPRVLDFGLDRRAKRGRQGVSCLAYAAPEILLGHVANPRSDLYSLGILAYQLLTRQLPFDEEDEGYLVQKQLQGKVDMRPVERLKRGAGIVQVLLGLLEKDPEQRPSSAEDVIRLMSAAIGKDYSSTISGSPEAYFTGGRFVGREKEMAFLQERAARVRENGRGWTVFLMGESGSGKSRCLEELRTWALLEGWRVVEGSCLAREERSYGPYRRILARAGALRPTHADVPEESAIFRFEDVSRMTEASPLPLSSGAGAGPFRDLVTREVVRLLCDCPTVLFLHDFHWADEATITVLDYLTSDILAHPIFLCVSFRPGEAAGTLGRLMEISIRQQRAEILGLEALLPDDVQEMISGLTCEASLGRDLAPLVHKSSGGNPFFVEEILKHLVDRKLLKREFGKWRLGVERLENLEVPSSVAVVLKQRLAQLSDGASAVAQWLALFRRAVPRDDLQLLSSLTLADFEAGIRELITRQIVCQVSGQHDECFEFRHALISEVITESIPESRRRRMHQSIGNVLEQHQSNHENLQELATHFTEGKAGEKAITYALNAARACKAEFANEAALRFYEFLLRKKSKLSPEQSTEVALEAADTCCALGNPKRAVKILRARLESCRTGERPYEVANLFAQLSRSSQFVGDMCGSERFAKRGLKLVRSEPAGLKRKEMETALLSQLAFCMLAKSEPRKGLAILNQFISLPQQGEHLMEEGHLLILMSALCGVACDFDVGARTAKRAIQILEPLNAYHLLPMAYSHLGVSLAGMGKLGKALVQHELAVVTAKQARSPHLLAQALCNATECYCRSGQYEAASQNSLQVVKVTSQTENRHLEVAGNLCLLEIQIATSDWIGALKTRGKLKTADLTSLPVYSKALALLLSASFQAELGYFNDALADLQLLDALVTSEAPIYEVSIGQILRARIYGLLGKSQECLALLRLLEGTVTRKRWAFQMALAKLELAEQLIRIEDWDGASKKVGACLRLSLRMPTLQICAKAHYLFGKIALLRFKKAVHPTSQCGTEQTPQSSLLLSAARSELERASMLSADPLMMDSAWRTHHLMVELGRLTQNSSYALLHAQETLKLVIALEMRFPDNELDSSPYLSELRNVRRECQQYVRDSTQRDDETELTINEMEASHLRLLLRVSNAVIAMRDLDQLIDVILNLLEKSIGAEQSLIALRADSDGSYKPAAKRNLSEDLLENVRSPIRWVLNQVARSGDPFVAANARSDARLNREDLIRSEVGMMFCAPLNARGNTLGLLYWANRQPNENLAESTINLFRGFANLAAVGLDNALAHRNLIQEKIELEQYLRETRGDYSEIVGKSDVLQKLRERIGLAAASPQDVLIWGESGTGKELVARALHRTGRRAGKRFVPLDCGSLSDSLVESELFGYRKGAFTGAMENRAGLLEAAEGGVVFP